MLLTVAFVALIAAFVYVGIRLTQTWRLKGWSLTIVWSLLSMMLLAILWFPASWIWPVDLAPWGLEKLQTWSIFLSMGLFLMLGLVVVARDIVWIVFSLLGHWSETREAGVSRPERRDALRQVLNLGTLFAASTVSAGAFIGARQRASVLDVEIPLSGLNPALDGFRIAQISDLHVGHTIGRQYVSDVVRCLNELDADLIAVTGDLTDGTVSTLGWHVEPLQELNSRYGAFFVTGNHDYYFGEGVEWVEETRRLGLTPLVNEHRVIEHNGGRLLLAGVPDYSAGDFVESHRSDPSSSLSGALPSDVKILLAHQPRSATAALEAGFDVQLSGHTHGGQIFPFHFVARLTQPVIAGLHRIGRMWLYVNSGTGYWGPPFRLFAPSEITLMTLRAD